MGLLNIKAPAGVSTSQVASKIKNSKRKVTTRKSTGNTIGDRIQLIRSKVEMELGDLKDQFILIKTEEELADYVDKCIENNIFAYDTETTSLEYITCELVGFSLYTPGMKACYVPVSHRSFVDNLLKENQLSLDVVNRQLKRLQDIPSIMHNGKFDINVSYFRFNWLFNNLMWDTMVASKIYNELEEAGLKYQYCHKIAKDGKVNDYSALFEGVNFAYVPVNIAYLYAAKDAQITYELYEYQKALYDLPENEKLKGVLQEIEIPLVPVVADMQRTGIDIDTNFANELSIKYHKMLEEAETELDSVCKMYGKEISEWNKHNPTNQFKLPLNPNSPKQVSMFLYDILGLDNGDARNAKKTGKEQLKAIEDCPVTTAILKCKEISKLLSTYIDKMPKEVNSVTGKIHASFNQNGTETGRFSSSDPNLQNIPSHNDDIRQMFVAGIEDGEEQILVFADYSQQEPKATAWLSQDKNMLEIYATDPDADLYPEVASTAFGLPADECREFRPDGTTNKEGKERRGQAKIIQLAMTYGQAAYSLAQSLGKKVKEAQEIQDKFFARFPGIREFTNNTYEFAYHNGYVETVWGRRRHLPDMQLEPYEFSWKDGVGNNFDLLDFESETEVQEVPLDIQQEYEDALDNCFRYSHKLKIIQQAAQENIKIVDNTSKIADAERKAINTPIQGTASDMIKLSMVNLWNNQEFRKLGGKIVLQIHDELGIRGPKKNAKELTRIFKEVMETSPQARIKLPWRCDMVICDRWYGEEIKLDV
jgi:DNA polymerase I-like protein with 3'-5' exonuclease and polymerase domains